MTWVATAIIGSAVIGAGASAYGANKAAKAAKSGSKQAIAAEREMFDLGRADLAPYREAGAGALDEITALYTGTPEERAAARARFEASPQYEFTRSEGLRGITNSRAAGGSGSGGNAVRGAVGFASNLASGEFGSYVDTLMGIAGLGSGATQVGVQAGSRAGSELANIYTNEGNTRASAYMAGASGVNSAIQGGLQNWAFNNYLNSGSLTPAAPQPTYSGSSIPRASAGGG